jgi:hypothetical protein
VGCGQGVFLRKLLALDRENTAIGFDPSYVGPETEMDGRLTFVPRFYGAAPAAATAEVAVCRHLIEHVPDPLTFVRSLGDALASSAARVFLETPCVLWILENEVVCDFFYEHCSLFSASSLAALLARAGFSVADARHVFGGQYLWLEGRREGNGHGAAPEPGRTPEAARLYGEREAAKIDLWRHRLADLALSGPTALWGAAAKGVTLANLIDPECRTIDCVIDVNPRKQGRFLPGTGHPIVGPDRIGPRGLRSAVLTNSLYLAEIEALLAERSLSLDLVSFS